MSGLAFGLVWKLATPQDLVNRFHEYVSYGSKEMPELIAHQGKEFADDLFKATPVAKASEIAAKVRSLGWRVKRPGIDRRMNMRKIHHAMKPLRRAMIIANSGRGNLEEFQNSIIKIRSARIGAMRAGWIPAMQKLGSKLNVAAGAHRKNIGRVELQLTGPNPRIIIVNGMPGILAVNAKHNIVGRAIHARIIDMEVYIERQKRKRATIFNPSGSI